MSIKVDVSGDLGEIRARALDLLEDAETMAEEIAQWRREFHQFPELAFEEKLTAAKVAQVLETIEGMDVTKGFGSPTSVVGVLRGEIQESALLIRADMDALALEEETGLPCSSCIPGIMHACGHDSHMASLLGAAVLLSRRQHLLQRPVVFLFQPAEEDKGGARALMEHGFISHFRVGKAMALHFWPRFPYGHFYTKPGAITSFSDRFHVEICGSGSHAATPHLGVDPIMVGAHTLLGLQHIISREKDPRASGVLTVGQIEAGEAHNIIPDRLTMQGTLRTFTPEDRAFLQRRLEHVVEGTCSTFNATSNVEYFQSYPQIWNQPQFTADILGKGRLFFGSEAVHVLDQPLLAGEDFSLYSLEVPSTFFLLGTGVEYGLHHPKYDVPEDLLHIASAWEAFLGLHVV